MRITLNIDDVLLAKAQRLSGRKETAALVRDGLEALIERESARRLERLSLAYSTVPEEEGMAEIERAVAEERAGSGKTPTRRRG
jgi:putative antitoxin of VapBC-like toxin-antitoxin system